MLAPYKLCRATVTCIAASNVRSWVYGVDSYFVFYNLLLKSKRQPCLRQHVIESEPNRNERWTSAFERERLSD